MPACLIECGFLTNENEAEWLADYSTQIDIAERLVQGVKRFFGTRQKPR